MKKLNLKVKGMTCSACEVLVERNLRKAKGVHSARVHRAREEVIVDCDDDVSLELLQKELPEQYTLSYEEKYDPNSNKEGNQNQSNSIERNNNSQIDEKNPIKNKIIKSSIISLDKKKYAEIGAVLVIILAAYLILKHFDFSFNDIGVTDNMSYGFIFLIGLVASASTCLAVSGGLLLAVAAKYNERHPNLEGWQRFRPHIYFNIGRIVSYTLLGGMVGLIGSVFMLSAKAHGIITLAASGLMVLMGIQLLHIFPFLSRIHVKMPKFIAHRIYDAGHKEGSHKASFFFGASTFFLPCGFTQALQLYVLGSGSFTAGALTMLAFSLGTLPSLAGIGAFSSFVKGNVQRHFMTFSAVLVIILGIFNIMPGITLVGASFPSNTNVYSLPTSGMYDPVEKQVLNMEVRGLDYYPSSFTVKKGIPVEWNIDGRNAQGCAKVISVPALKILERLPYGVKTIKFTPQQTGNIMFSCSMGMAGPGTFKIIA